MKHNIKDCVALFSALLILGTATASYADIGGFDAGSIAAQVDQQRAWMPKDDDPDIEVDFVTEEKKASEVKIKVNSFTFSGTDIYPEWVLQALVKDDCGKEYTFDELQEVVRKVTNFFHKNGYLTAIAYTPTQDIINGAIRIDILPGYYGYICFDNTSELTIWRAEGLARAARKGRLIKRHPLDRLLLILNDIPGVKAQAILFPGQATGTADTVFKLTTTEKWGGVLYLDNYGSRHTGRWRQGGGIYKNNLTHVGDQLSINYLLSFTGDLKNYSLRYELPVGRHGTFAGIEFLRTNYELGENYDFLDAYGVAQGWRIFSRTPLKRTLNNNLFFHLQYSHMKLVDRMDFFPDYNSEKHSDTFRFGLDGDYRTTRAVSTYKIMHNIGRIGMDTETARYMDQVYKTEGLFQKTTFDFYHIQKLNNRLMLHLSLNGQYAWSNLDSSEKIYIGGYNAVRAFPQGETGGDTGFKTTAELRWQLGDKHWQLAAFYDYGWVRYNKGEDASRSLSGAGIGVIFNESGKCYARLDYAFPLGNRTSSVEGRKQNGMIWFQFVQRF